MYIYKHLTINEEEATAYLLGYNIKLTKKELKILCRVANASDGIDKIALVDSIGRRRIQPQNANVHICNINKKAFEIGGRKLILCEKGKYYLNGLM